MKTMEHWSKKPQHHSRSPAKGSSGGTKGLQARGGAVGGEAFSVGEKSEMGDS